MARAARAVNSRAVSSISFADIFDIPPEAVARGARAAAGGRLSRSRQRQPGTSRPWIGNCYRQKTRPRVVVRDPLPPPAPPALPLTLLFVPPQLVLHRVHERLPGGLDDVVRDPDGPPRLVAVTRGDEDTGLGPGGLRLVEDAHLVVEQRHLAQVRVEVLEGLAEGVIEG